MVTIDQITAKYPRLYHMADPRNIAGLLKRGLQSTQVLLDLVDLDDSVRSRLLRNRRAEATELVDDDGDAIVIRDQKPLNMLRLAGSLTQGSAEEFIAFINQRVFFWPTVERLKTMNSAKAYRENEQLVFVIHTGPLLKQYWDYVRLSRINSGATMPFAFARSTRTFEALDTFDWGPNRRQFAELTVESGVPDIWDFVDELQLWKDAELLERASYPLDESVVNWVLHL